MLILVNYNDQAWVTKFITQVLTEEDFLNILNQHKNNSILDKAGYTRIETCDSDGCIDYTYVFVNGDGRIEDDRYLVKFKKHIEDNPLFKKRFKEAFIKSRDFLHQE